MNGNYLNYIILFMLRLTNYINFYYSELIKIDEIIEAVRKLQNIPDEDKLQQISEVLSKIDNDHDGSIRLDTVLKVSCIIYIFFVQNLHFMLF
jgi:Ca2+-binding EF-hand superfamily protein